MTWRDDVARWALFVSIALLLGVVGIRLLVLPRTVDARVERRVHVLGTAGAVLALNAGIIGFVIRSANALQVSGRRPALRGPLAVRRGDPLRDRLPRHDARVRASA